MAIVCLVSQGGMASTYSGYPLKGTIKGLNVTYNDGDTVTITSGYCEANGEYWELTSPTDHDMTSLASAEDFHYIYVDTSDTSNYPTPAIIDSTDEPAWSDAKQGWYYGDDRCIGVVYSEGGSASIKEYRIYGDVVKWKYSSNQLGIPIANYIAGSSNTYDWKTPTTESSTKLPVNANGALLHINSLDSASDKQAVIYVCSYEMSVDAPHLYAADFCDGSYLGANSKGMVDLGPSRNIRLATDVGDDSISCWVYGFRITR